MAVFASLLAASALRVASLNLCADEYLLLLARPREVVSVTRLAQDPEESVLAPIARRFAGNRGRLEDVVALRPTLILTMGGAGRSSMAIARSMGLTVLDLPQPNDIDQVSATLVRVATALGDPGRAAPLVRRLEAVRATTEPQRDAIWLGNGGLTLAPRSLGAQWLALAGLRQRALPGGRAMLEALVTRPPAVLVMSRYRAGQVSQGQRWLDHPLLARLASRKVSTDGRPWTCGGPVMIDAIERLRRDAR